MQISRRRFGKLSSSAVLILAAGVSPFMTGCGIFSDILAWTAVAGVAIDGIVAVLGSFMPPGGAQIVEAIKAVLTDLAGAVTEYQNDTNPADKATLLAKIRALLGDISANFQALLSQINLGNNPIVTVVVGLAEVILSAVMGFLGQLPAAGKALSVTVLFGGKPIPVVPKYYKNVQEFKADYNAVCAANGHAEIEIR